MKGEKQNNKNKSKKEWRECVWVYGEDREEKIGVGTCVEEKKPKGKKRKKKMIIQRGDEWVLVVWP